MDPDDLAKITTAFTDIIPSGHCIVQDYSFIWLAVDVNEANISCQNIRKQLENVGNDINIFTDPDECVDFLTDLEDVKAVLVIDDTFDQQIAPLIYDICQLDHLYVASSSGSPPYEWTNKWSKAKDVHTTGIPKHEVSSITAAQDNHDSIAVSFVPSNGSDLSQTQSELEASFMYTQILKEILLEMKHDQKAITNFVAFSRTGNYRLTNDIDRFEREYHNKTPIWWYSHLGFIYRMLNTALRELRADIIIRMGFFISDLHNQIKQLHSEQLHRYDAKPFQVYRGQSLLKTDFEKLLKTKGGFMSFNNFLSTSRNKNVSLVFAHGSVSGTDTIGILFRMTIDPVILSSPFADIQDISSQPREEEIIFSMHTVFHVKDVKPIDNDSALYQVDLELTDDDDEQLRILTKHIQNDTRSGTGWKRLGDLLLKIDQFDKVEELYTELLEETSNDDDKIYYCNQLVTLKHIQGAHEASAKYALKLMEIQKKIARTNGSLLPASDNNMVFSSYSTGENSRILYFRLRSVSIDEETPIDNLSLITSDNEIAKHDDAGSQHSNTLFHEKALQSYQRTLAPDCPDLDTMHNNFVGIFENMDQDSRVLLLNEKILEIRQETLPPDHPDLAISYNMVADQYISRKEYSKALSFYEKSLEISKKILPLGHPYIASVYCRMGLVYDSMEEYPKALSFYQTALEIWQRSLPSNHSNLSKIFNSIGEVYSEMKEYAQALSFHQKSLEILERNPTADQHELVTSYNTIGTIYFEMEEYTQALSFFEKSSKIFEKTPTADQYELANLYNTIGTIYFEMKEYTQALPFFQKSTKILEEIPTPDYYKLAVSYDIIATVYCKMQEYTQAISFCQKLLQILEKPSATDRHRSAVTNNTIGAIYFTLQEYTQALHFHEKALEINQEIQPPNYLGLTTTYNFIGTVYDAFEDYSKALSYFQLALDTSKLSLSADDSRVKVLEENIAIIKGKLVV